LGWLLILTIWYSLSSEPSGVWHFTQGFSGLNTKEECEKFAKKEMEEAAKYKTPISGFKPLIGYPFGALLEYRSMIVVNETYNCVEKEKMK
jgi:hypothetical protein